MLCCHKTYVSVLISVSHIAVCCGKYDERFHPFKNCIPKIGRILLVNLVSNAVLAGFLMLLRMVSGFLLNVIDKSAFTSGDLPHLFRSWQGIAVTIIGIAVLFIYVAVDLNVSIILSKEIIEKKRSDFRIPSSRRS